MVLLKNDDGMLPIDRSSIATLAVVGPNAERARIMGGGSASFTPHYRVPPSTRSRKRSATDVKIVYEQGCDIERTIPPIVADFDIAVDDGAERARRRDGRLIWLGGLPGGGTSFRATASLVPKTAGPHVLSLVQLGPTRVLLDGALVLDGVTNPPPRGRELFAMGSEAIEATVELDTSAHELVVEYTGGTSGPLEGVQVGCRALPPSDLMDRAVAAAAGADAAIVVVGTNDDWESEGHDREFMELPGDQAELIRRVAAANPRTVVAVNAASPVTMDWADAVPAVLVTWFGGQEMANALADVLFGETDPSGRLPTTFPVRLEHNPSYGNFPGENGQVRYGEGVLRRVPLVRGARAAGRVPVRPRLVVHHVRRSARRACRATTFTRGRHAHGRRRRDQHRRSSGRRSRAVLRGAAPPERDPSAEGAQGLRQGVARSRRDDDRRRSSSTTAPFRTGSRRSTPHHRGVPGPRSRPPNRLPHPIRDGASTREATTFTSADRRQPPIPCATVEVALDVAAPRPQGAPRPFTVISVDDHLIEPADLFDGRMPAAPRRPRATRRRARRREPGVGVRGRALPEHRPQRGDRATEERVEHGPRALRRDAQGVLGHPRAHRRHGHRGDLGVAVLPVVAGRVRGHDVRARQRPGARAGVRARVERLAPRGVGGHVPRADHSVADHLAERPGRRRGRGAAQRGARLQGVELPREPAPHRSAVDAHRSLGPVARGVRGDRHRDVPPHRFGRVVGGHARRAARAEHDAVPGQRHRRHRRLAVGARPAALPAA